MALYFLISIYKMSFFSLKHYTCCNSYTQVIYVKLSITNNILVLSFNSCLCCLAFISNEPSKEAMVSKNKFKS